MLLASLNEAMLSAVTHSKLPYDVEKDLVPVSMVAEFLFVLSTPAKGPATLQEFMEWARRNPKQVSIGCAGAGTPSCYHGLMLGAKGGFDANMIPFLGGAPLMTALAGGQVAAAMNAFGPDMIGMHRAGRTRIIGMTGESRSAHPDFTNVPTFGESELPTIPSGWFGLFLPVGTKPATVQAWNQALAEALAMEDVKAKFLDMGLTPRASSPQGLGDTVRKDLMLWKDFFKTNDMRWPTTAPTTSPNCTRARATSSRALRSALRSSRLAGCRLPCGDVMNYGSLNNCRIAPRSA